MTTLKTAAKETSFSVVCASFSRETGKKERSDNKTQTNTAALCLCVFDSA